MKELLLRIVLLVAAMAALAGCVTNSGVIPFGPDTYTVVRVGRTGFSSLGAVKIEAYKEVNAFAESKGKQADIISVNEIPAGATGSFGQWPQVEIKFRLVAHGTIPKAPQIEATSTASYDAAGRRTDAAVQVRGEAPKSDLYTELTKLDELRKNKLITEEEFQAERKRIMARPR